MRDDADDRQHERGAERGLRPGPRQVEPDRGPVARADADRREADREHEQVRLRMDG